MAGNFALTVFMIFIARRRRRVEGADHGRVNRDQPVLLRLLRVLRSRSARARRPHGKMLHGRGHLNRRRQLAQTNATPVFFYFHLRQAGRLEYADELLQLAEVHESPPSRHRKMQRRGPVPGPALQGLAYARDVLARASIHLDDIALVQKQRHLNRGARLKRRRLRGAR